MMNIFEFFRRQFGRDIANIIFEYAYDKDHRTKKFVVNTLWRSVPTSGLSETAGRLFSKRYDTIAWYYIHENTAVHTILNPVNLYVENRMRMVLEQLILWQNEA